MLTPFIEFMKFSPSVLITLAVMMLLVIALVILSFSLGNQYAAMRITKTLTQQMQRAQNAPASTTAETPPASPTMTLPSVPRLIDEHPLDRALRGTVLRFSQMNFGEAFTLTLPDGAYAPKNEVYVYFVDVVYDSRCPENVDCKVAGEAIVEVELKAFDKPTQTVYLSTQTGGKPDYWSYHGLQDDSFMTPEIKAEIARGQKIVAETTYVKGETYNSGGAVVDGYTVNLRGLTPYRADQGDAPISKNNYRATFVVTKK